MRSLLPQPQRRRAKEEEMGSHSRAERPKEIDAARNRRYIMELRRHGHDTTTRGPEGGNPIHRNRVSTPAIWSRGLKRNDFDERIDLIGPDRLGRMAVGE